MNGIANTFFLFFLFSASTILSEVHWADRVISFSSQYGEKQYSANQSLGKPNILTNIKSPCSWTPIISIKDKYESIHLGFDSKEKSQFVYINVNIGYKALALVSILDNQSKEYSIYNQEQILENTKGKIILKLNEPIQISSIKLYFDLKSIDTEVQLDAVGIGNDTNSIWQINEIESKQFNSVPENMGIRINSIYSELSPIVSADGKKLFFTRAGHPDNMGADKKQDVWESDLQDDGRFGEAFNLYEPVNDKNNNFAFSTNSDGTMLLMGRNTNSQSKSDLSYSVHLYGKWTEIKKFDFTNLENTTPFLSFSLSQSQNLMFVSMEREDGYGGLDLYYSQLTDSGWTAVKNLGPTINTAADEITPYIANDNKTLYFASNGYPGYGNMDLFVSHTDDSLGYWSEPKNLGKNINSEGWEAYLTISSQNDYAYYVSTHNSIGKEDIFRVELPKEAQPEKSILVHGTVREFNTNKNLTSRVEFRNLETNKIVGLSFSDSTDGEYQISLPSTGIYGVNAYSKEYYSFSQNIKIDSNYAPNKSLDIVLKKIEVGQTYDMNNIFFEFGKSELNVKSVNELQKLVYLLKTHKKLKIMVIGFTDTIGSEKDNKKLSEERAKAVYNYLIENGIDKNRLKYEGKGELKSDNNGNLGDNRKVVFKIVEGN